MQLPDLESLRCFVAAAEQLNFRAASQVVGLTPAALGQRIKKLEEHLEVTLFERTTRRVELTESGLALLPEARAALEQARACIHAARGELGPPPQDVVVGTRHELGLSWLVPMRRGLQAAHPGVTVHLYFGSGPDLELQLRQRQIDVAVSSRQPQDPAIAHALLHEEAYVFVAHPELVAERPLADAEDAARHVLVDTSPELPLFRYWRESGGPIGAHDFGGLVRMGTIEAMRLLVVAGDGVAVLPRYLVQPDLDAGRLVALFPEVQPRPDHFRLLFLADDPRRALYEAMAKTMRAEPLK